MKKIRVSFLFLIISLFSNLIFAQGFWQQFNSSNSGIVSDTVTGVYIDNNNAVWVGTVRGVSKLDGGKWTNYTSSNMPLLGNGVVRAITQFNGDYYFGGYGFYSLINFDGTNWNTVPGISVNEITTLESDNAGNLWIGTNDNGVMKYDGTNVVNYNSSNSQLPADHVQKIYKDNIGNIWVTMADLMTYQGGIAKYDGNSWQIFTKQNSKLTNDNIHSITEDNLGNMWFGTDSLLLFKYDGTNWTKYDLSENITSNYLSSLDVDSKGNIWAGLGWFSSERGLIKFDGVNITRYKPSQGFPSDRDILDLKIDSNNSIWIAAWDGLIKLNNDPSINIETMVGIDTLKSLTNVNIQWNNYFSGNVNIEYSTDNGGTWNVAANSVSAQDHNYSWNVPVVAPISSECKVRVSDVNNSTNKVVSGKLTIYAKVDTPFITPNGGIKNNGINVSISCKVENADIYFTTDGRNRIKVHINILLHFI